MNSSKDKINSNFSEEINLHNKVLLLLSITKEEYDTNPEYFIKEGEATLRALDILHKNRIAATKV